jgi:hypothetical protein
MRASIDSPIVTASISRMAFFPISKDEDILYQTAGLGRVTLGTVKSAKGAAFSANL